MIKKYIQDFLAPATYTDQSIAGHVPETSDTGNAWSLVTGICTLTNHYNGSNSGIYFPGYNSGPGNAAHINLGSWKPRTYRARLWVENITSQAESGIRIRDNAAGTDYFYIGFHGNVFGIYDSDPRPPDPDGVQGVPDYNPSYRHYLSGSPAGVLISNMSSQQAPIANSSVWYIDLVVIDDGTNVQVFSNGSKMFDVDIPFYSGNTYLGVAGGDWGWISGALTGLSVENVEKIDYENAALNRLLYQYKDATNLKTMILAMADQCFDAKVALDAIRTGRDLPTAITAQLDLLGNILNVPRGAMVDADYRAALYLKIFQNFSEGTIEDLIRIFGILMNSTWIVLTEYSPATIALQATGPTDPDLIHAKIAVETCKAAGVQIDSLSYSSTPAFAFSEDTDPNTAGYDDGTGTVGGYQAEIF